jgi:type VI secretion system protein ImpB
LSFDSATTGAAEKKAQLPFVIGTMGDYSGNASTVEKASFAERAFVNINGENFDEVMGKIKPGVDIKVKETLSGKEDSMMSTHLDFTKMEDFEPLNIAKQVPALAELLAAKEKLEQILAKADMSEKFEDIIANAIQDKEQLAALSSVLLKDKLKAEENNSEASEEVKQS